MVETQGWLTALCLIKEGHLQVCDRIYKLGVLFVYLPAQTPPGTEH